MKKFVIKKKCCQNFFDKKRGAETNLKVCENVPVNPNYKPKRYIVAHYCMNETIDLETVEWGAPNSKPKGYRGNTVIPTHAPHRPVWANFGEYAYLPPERYQHNIEHGCIVMLYHPCLDKKQVTQGRVNPCPGNF